MDNCKVKGLGKYGDPRDLVSTTKSARNVTGELHLEPGGK